VSVSKPFDAAAKHLFKADPIAWLRFLGLPGRAAHLIAAELTAVSGSADCVLRVKNPDYLLHVEFQVSYDRYLDSRVHYYNAALHRQYHLPVKSVVILLRQQAERKQPFGHVAYDGLSFEYRVVRPWQLPVADFLEGPLVLVPFAPTADVPASRLPEVVQGMKQRLDSEASAGERGDLWMAARLLMGLRGRSERINQLLKGVPGMKESSVYQEILKEGRDEGLEIGREEGRAQGTLQGERRLLLRLGRARLGEPDARTLSALEQITDAERLEDLAVRLAEVETWQELVRL
jgi:predicted transposase YdaD